MVMDYTYFFVEANIVCIIFFAMMLISELRSVGKQSKQLIFIMISVYHIMYFISDIFWALVTGGVLPTTRLSASAVNLSNGVLLGFLCAVWFIFVELTQGEKYITNNTNRFYTTVPAILSALVMVIMFIFFPWLVLDENYKVTTLYNVIFLLVPFLYVIACSVRSFIRALRKENYTKRFQFLICAIYPLLMAVFGLLQTVMNGAPIFCFGCAIMMLYVYILSLNDQVSLDELTRLNNRSQLNKYLVSESSKQLDKCIRYILMIDLNKFKQINDKYGHVEGDYALKRAADALKASCSQFSFKTFIARYGGDEFIIITKDADEDQVIELSDCIKETLVRLNEESGAEYELTASIGYSSFTGDIFAFQSAVVKADEALYEDKNNREASVAF